METCETPCASVAALVEKVSGHEQLFQEHVSHGKEKLSEFGMQIKECVTDLKNGAGVISRLAADQRVQTEKQNARLREGDTKFQSMQKEIDDGKIVLEKSGLALDKKITKLVDSVSAQGEQQKKRLRPVYAVVSILTLFLFSTEHGPELAKWLKMFWPW